jgi:splicing factor 3B subunit 5
MLRCFFQAADRFSINKSWDAVQSKFVGTGHADMTKYEWATSQHRDTMASHIGHYDQLSFFAVAQNDSIGRVRYQLLEVSQ